MKLNIRPVLSFSLALLLAVPSLAATKPGGGGNKNNGAVRSTSRSNVNEPSHNAASNRNDNKNTNNNRNVNNNTNVNRDVNVNTHTSYNSGYYGGSGCCYHSNTGVAVAAAVATTAVVTAAIVGSRVNTLPPNCTTVIANGVTYQQCGGSYYQPQFSGGNTTYIVVNQP